MKPKFSGTNAMSMSHSARIVLGVVGVLGFGAVASAANPPPPTGPGLNDKPYFNLFTGTYGSGSAAAVGDGAAVSLCGSATCDSSGYAAFSVIPTNSGAGSGNIDPFLRFQHNEQDNTGNATTEMAYNTSQSPLQGLTDGTPDLNFMNQAKDAGGTNFNHAIKYSAIVAADGSMTFKLDINEPGGEKCGTGNNKDNCVANSLLRLDELQFFISTTDKLSLYDPGWNNVGTSGATSGNFSNDPLGGGSNTAKFWDMGFAKGQAGGYGGLLLNNLHDEHGQAGSGDYDVQVVVPETAELKAFLAGHQNQELYVYLYNFAGEADTGNCPNGQTVKAGCGEAAAGFEEWAAVTTNGDGGGGGGQGVPIPATAFLVGAGLLGMVRKRRS